MPTPTDRSPSYEEVQSLVTRIVRLEKMMVDLNTIINTSISVAAPGQAAATDFAANTAPLQTPVSFLVYPLTINAPPP